MSNVVDIFSERQKREDRKPPTKGAYLFSIDLYAPVEGDNPDSTITCPDGAPTADDLRYFAQMLWRMARMVHDEAESISPSPDGMIMAEAVIFNNSRVRTFISNFIGTTEQRAWLARRFDDAKSTI